MFILHPVVTAGFTDGGGGRGGRGTAAKFPYFTCRQHVTGALPNLSGAAKNVTTARAGRYNFEKDGRREERFNSITDSET